jgi:hypothetical protein
MKLGDIKMGSGCGDGIRLTVERGEAITETTANRWHVKAFIACKHGEV